MKTLTRVGLVILVTFASPIPGGAVQGQRNAARRQVTSLV